MSGMDEQGKLREKNPLRFVSAGYLRWTAYGLLLLLAALLQMTPRLLPAVCGARPLLLVPLVVCIALFTGPMGGAAAGVAAGLLWDVFSERLFGFNALLLLVAGCACGLLVRLLLRNNLWTALLLCAGAGLFQVLCDWFFNYALLAYERPFTVLAISYLPNLLYTLILSPLLYAMTYGVTKLLRNRQ